VIIYSRFIRPVMPAGNVRNTRAYIAPSIEKEQARNKPVPRVVPIKPAEAGSRLNIRP